MYEGMYEGMYEDTRQNFFITKYMTWWGKQYTARGFGISDIKKFDCMTFFWSLHVQKHNWIIKIKEINFHFPQYGKPQDIYFFSTIIKTMA